MNKKLFCFLLLYCISFGYISTERRFKETNLDSQPKVGKTQSKFDKKHFKKRKSTRRFKARHIKNQNSHITSKVPSFSIMVKWGLSPKQALLVRKKGSVCAANKRSQKILARHRWRCK